MLTENLTTVELIACANEEFKQERYSFALLFYKSALKNDDFPHESFAHLGRVYAKLALFDEAKHAFEQFLERFPEAYIEKFQLGLVYRDLRNQDRAIELFDQVISEQPNFPPALYYKSLVCLEKDDLTSVQFLLNQLLQVAEEDNLYVKLTRELAEKVGIELNVLPADSEVAQ